MSRHVPVCLWPRTLERLFEIGHVLPEGDCLVWHGPGTNYGQLTEDHAHRLAWRLANGDEPIPPGTVIRHSCDRMGCVAPAHLLAGTARDNIHDALDRGRLRGFFKSTLTEAQVRDVVWPGLKSGRSALSLAEELGVSKGAIYGIKQHKSWKQVIDE